MTEPTFSDIALPAFFLVISLKLLVFPPELNDGLLKTRKDQVRLAIVLFIASAATAARVLLA